MIELHAETLSRGAGRKQLEYGMEMEATIQMEEQGTEKKMPTIT